MAVGKRTDVGVFQDEGVLGEMLANKLKSQLGKILKALEKKNAAGGAGQTYQLIQKHGVSIKQREKLRDTLKTWSSRKVTIGTLDCESLIDIRENHDFLFLRQRFDYPEKGIKTKVLNGDETYAPGRTVMYEQTPIRSGCGG